VVLLFGLMIISGFRPAQVHAIQVAHRPISDFVSAQGTTSIFIPPVPDYIGWTTPEGRAGSVDYAGVANNWLMANGLPQGLGTTTDGTITERSLADGRAEVSVLLHTKNALTYVFQCNSVSPLSCDFANDVVLFGHRAQQVALGADAALGDSFLNVVFKNPAPGLPMPDVVANNFCIGPNSADCELVSLSIHANANGALRAAFGVPDGTPGKAIVAQTGVLFRAHFKGATGDGFPAELIELRVVGGKSGK
jgi:hypothetical protein